MLDSDSVGRWWCVFGLVVLPIACGDSESGSGGSDCSPGTTRECLGPGACTGAQQCGGDGAWGECDCGSAGQGGGASDAGAAGSAGASNPDAAADGPDGAIDGEADSSGADGALDGEADSPSSDACSVELCNGLDDDCDGVIDDGANPCGGACLLAETPGTPCDGADSDACVEGIFQCDGLNAVVCSDASGDGIESCNGVDDDCNGQIDEGTNGCGGVCPLSGLSAPCDGTDSDLCNEGVGVCSGANDVACSDSTADTLEICNGADDDCDGVVDDGNPNGGVPCVVCGPGVTKCVSGQLVCDPTGPPPAEVCNGLDDDCDGQIDEGVPAGNPCIVPNKAGVCASGITQCANGSMICAQTTQPSIEVCNGLDDNCNGAVDEGGVCP